VRSVDVVEVDQRGRRAGIAAGALGDLEHRAIAVGSVRAIIVGPAVVCRAEQISGGIENQARIQVRPIGTVEADQRG